MSNSVEVAVRIGLKVLEALFAAGMIGSALVILLTAVEDLETMFGGNGEQK